MDSVINVQEDASCLFLAALSVEELARRHAGEIVLVQVLTCFPTGLADAFKIVFANLSPAAALKEEIAM